MTMWSRGNHSRSVRNLLCRPLDFVLVLVVAAALSAGSAHAQQQPPGYLGPPQPVATGPSKPSPNGPVVPLAAPLLPNVRVNDKVDDAPNQSQSETSMAVDPTNPLRLIGGFNDCRGFSVPSRNGISGWGFSLDGGATWTGVETGLPKADPGHFGARGDPSIDVDADGNFYYANLYSKNPNPSNPPFDVSVHRGHFTGTTFVWETPVIVTNFSSGFGADKEHIGVDKRPGANTIYVSYTNFTAGGNGQVEVVRSTDGGQTWSAPVIIAAASGTVHQGSLPRVGPDGEVYVVWEDGFAQPTGSLHIRKSASWPDFGPDITVSTVTHASNPPFNSRNPDFPTMDIDRTNGPNRGRVYVAWHDGQFGGPGNIGAILLTHSADGTTWSAPVMVNDDGQPSATGTHHWFPWLVVDVRGVANLGWYDRRLRGTQADLTDAFAAQFTVSAGVSPNQRLTSQSFSMNVPSACTPNFGDYNGAAASPSRFHFIYGDGRLGNPDTFSAGFLSSPILANPDRVEACRPTPTSTNITLLGGPGLFENDVTLSLASVNPGPPPGGEITATFNPNPVPAPPPTGSNSTMTINTTDTTPPNSYTLTVQGNDGTRSESTTVSLTVRSQIPDGPGLQAPANGSDGVVETPAFSWSATEQASAYRLQIFTTLDCSGTPLRDFDNIATNTFTVPAAQSLPFFQTFSWTVLAKNSCGSSAPAQCFSFRTRSCAVTAHDIVKNGGFEQGLSGWIVDATVPEPVVTTERPHSGTSAVKLGNILPPGTPTAEGNSEIHQTFTLPAGALNAKLSFWFWPQSFDSVQFDQQEVFVVPIDPPGPAVTLMREANNAQTYLLREFSLDAFRGKTFEIHFRVHDDAAPNPTGMFVDDVQLTFVSCGPPDFFLTVMPPTFNEVCAGNSIPIVIGVESLNGPNFTSPVQLSAVNLPEGTSATFSANPVPPGGSSILTLSTTRPAIGGRRFFNVVGVAVVPPPEGPRATTVDTFISANIPDAPEQIAPLDGQFNVPRRPTLSWTAPIVPDLTPAPRKPGFDPSVPQMGNLPDGIPPEPDGGQVNINVFGAARYRVQVARDTGFGSPVINADTPETMFTAPADLDLASTFFWRVNGTNACGTSPFSATRSFVTGACFESWEVNPPIPITDGPSQSTVVAVAGKIYEIGGGVGPGPDTRINQVWEFDPATNNWTRKADVPTPGPGSAYGSAVEFGGKIYVFGGVMGPPGPITVLRTLWIYDVAANTWSRGRDLPSDNFGIAVAKVGSKIILAYGSGFALQTWEYDPATDNYTRKADPPSIPAPFRVHGAAIGNEMHAFAGGGVGGAHVIYNAATNSWRTAPLMPFGVTDPAVSVINGKFYVVGGRPIARTQIFDPATNTWSQGPTVAGLPNGVDNTGGDVIGSKFYLVGGFDGANGINAHRVFTVCGAGAAQQIPYVADGDGTVPGIPNESTALVLSNDLASSITATVFFYRTDGTLDSSRAFTLASKETQVLNDIIRRVRGTSGVQNVEGSLLVLASQSLDAIALVNSNATNDLSVVDGQLLTGISNGFVPVIQWNSPYRTQVVLDNASSAVANAQLLAYPPGGGDAPQASTSVTVPPRGILDFPNIVTALGLPVGYSGQLTWNSTGPLFVFARQLTLDGGFSGAEPVHKLTDGSSTQVIGYVEDTDDFSTSLLLNNPGGFTADVTVLFFDVGDPAGGTAGDVSSRDLQVHVNSATSISDIVRWVLRSSSGTPTGKRGFLVITSPQTVTAQVSLVNRATADPANLDSGGAASNAFTSFILAGATRVAITNPGATLANVDLAAFNPDGSPAGAPTRIQVVGRGQFFTEDIAPFLTLPTGFVGSMTVRSDAPVIVLNQERTPDNRGAIVPVHPR